MGGAGRGGEGSREGRGDITLHRVISFLRSFDFPFFGRAKEARRKRDGKLTEIGRSKGEGGGGGAGTFTPRQTAI